jgi:predicted GH43/DUF377 family glycosyl hydrolase
MMKYLWLLFLSFTFLFISCKNENIVNPEVSGAKGTVMLSLDKGTIPSDVQYVTVALTRDGYSQITGTLNITTDSSAEVVLNQIPAGMWHVKVDASNSNNMIIYSGEADVNIVSDQTAVLNLTLYSVNSGVGGIKIVVNWYNGINYNSNWRDNEQSPILTGTLNYEYAGVAHPYVIYDEGIYKMWYTSVEPSATGRIFYATSSDGINWTKRVIPVLSPSSNGFDNRAVTMAKVIKAGNMYYLFYGSRGNNFPVCIGLAASTDGINWVKKEYPILQRTLEWENELYPADIVYANNKYYLYYYSNNTSFSNVKIGLAVSSDGMNFVKESNPIITADLSWEGGCLTSPSVIFENGKFQMAYLSYPNCKYIGYAVSNDGKNWTKNVNPIFSSNLTTNQWLRAFNTIQLTHINNKFRIYYSGVIQNSDYYQIGCITKTD